MAVMNVLEAVREAMREEMARDDESTGPEADGDAPEAAAKAKS